jgi:hypothetical protein
MVENHAILSAPLSEAIGRKTWEAPRIEDASIEALTAKAASIVENTSILDVKNGS